jgi:cytochrome oxidase assembly protein ShyY1
LFVREIVIKSPRINQTFPFLFLRSPLYLEDGGSLFIRDVSGAVPEYRKSYASHDHTIRATNIEGRNRQTQKRGSKKKSNKERKKERGVAALWRQLYGGRR